MANILQTVFGNTICDRKELMIFKSEFSWTLNVDLLVLDELHLS